MVIAFTKRSGETMTACMHRMRSYHNIASNEKVTYAGRLDPAASGVALFLSGPDRYRKSEFLGFNKTYELDILFGITTDTLDLLGVRNKTESVTSDNISLTTIKELTSTILGERNQAYPDFSARRVEGKPIWQHTLYGNKKTVMHRSHIYSFVVQSLSSITASELQQRVSTLCTDLSDSDFRQSEIVQSWSDISDYSDYTVAHSIVSCSSGSYMRTLAQDIGLLYQMPTLAMRIHRVSIHTYTEDSVSNDLFD